MDEQKEKSLIPTEQTSQLPDVLKTILSPIIQTMCETMERLNETMSRVATAQQLQSERMAELEKQIRLNTPVTPSQVRHMNDAIKHRAQELLDGRKIDDAKAQRQLGNMIRKSVLARYGVSALHEIPRHEYSVAMAQISMWLDTMQLMNVIKEARMRHENVGMENT